MKKDPSDRYLNGNELCEALRSIKDEITNNANEYEKPTVVLKSIDPPPAQKNNAISLLKNKTTLILIGIAILILVITIVVITKL